MFIGDAANLTFLQNVRRIAHVALGRCAFVDDPLRHHILETYDDGHERLIIESAINPPSKPTSEDANYLIHWYILATNCVLDAVDQHELFQGMSEWLLCSREEPCKTSAIYYLVLALGAQSCPESRDSDAEKYFNFGRYITLMTLMEDPSLAMIQSHVHVAMYLLAGSRRNSAFMYLGTAVRAAYALGLHRLDISALYPTSECLIRERLWKAIRILDLFMSASLGRPPSTTETRDTTVKENYSASNDLCLIFENILAEIYAKRMVSSETLEWISGLHRGWTSRFMECPREVGTQCAEQIVTERGEAPNIGLIHLKEAYYWTIMLLSRPTLVEKVSLYASAAAESDCSGMEQLTSSASNDILASACVDSAARTIELLAAFIMSTHVPKRLPFVVNSAFMSALVLGLGIFGDMDRVLPLRCSLSNARVILAKFSPHDSVARRYLTIVDNFQNACDKYVEVRTRRDMDYQSRLIGELFGSVHIEAPDAGGCSSNNTSARNQNMTSTGPFTPLINGSVLSAERPVETPIADDSNSLPDNSLLFQVPDFLNHLDLNNTNRHGSMDNILLPFDSYDAI